MKQISRTLTTYVTDECNQTIPKGPGAGDLKIIATDGHNAETIKAGLRSKGADAKSRYTDYTIQLLKLVLVAVINSPKAANYIQTMPTLSMAAQSSLRELIEEVMNMNAMDIRKDAKVQQLQSPSYPPSDVEKPRRDKPGSLVKSTTDPQLLFEERLGKVMADNDRLASEKKDLQKDLRDLHTRLTRLQDNNVGCL